MTKTFMDRLVDRAEVMKDLVLQVVHEGAVGAMRRLETWALSKNPPGSYKGEDDKRWAYTIETDGDAYLTRIMLPRLNLPIIGSLRPMIHHFHRRDQDRHLHNHPWDRAWSFLITGSYDEERLIWPKNPLSSVGMGCEKRHVKWFNTLTAQDYHAVTKLNGEVWTLFVTGNRVQDWGFYVDGRHVPWRDYFKERDMPTDEDDWPEVTVHESP